MTENDIHETLTQAPDEIKLRIAYMCNGNVERIKGLEKTTAALLNAFQSSYGECIKYLGGLK